MSGESLRDRLASLSRRELVGLLIIALVALAGLAFWYVRSLPRPIEVRAEPRDRPPVAAPTQTPVVLVVHVAGWVRRPGVYDFREGDRVVDAVRAAGGPRAGAELGSLNLAAPLSDGQQVLVPRRGSGGEATTPTTGGAPADDKVNVNTAGATELESLPGIGEVLAQRIIEYRTGHGPFSSVDELLSVSGIGEVTLEEIRDFVTV